jgi:hypothetical protein
LFFSRNLRSHKGSHSQGNQDQPTRRSSRKALTPEEILKVLRVASESKRNLAMILLAYRHGMRASEVCELRLSDLDLKNGQITIRRLKGRLTATQPLSDHPGLPLLSERRAWLAERRDASDFVFFSQKGGGIHRSQFFRILPIRCRKGGPASGSAASSLPQARARIRPGCEQGKPGHREASPRAQKHRLHSDLRRPYRRTDWPGRERSVGGFVPGGRSVDGGRR